MASRLVDFGYICTWVVSYVYTSQEQDAIYASGHVVRSTWAKGERVPALTSSRVFQDYGIGKDSYDRGHG